MIDLSILIPSRNEMFLSRTVDDILSNIEADTEIIVVLDGAWADPGIKNDPRVTILYHPESVGQRAATNHAAKIARGKYLIKTDAHCAFDKGFDRKLLSVMQDDWVLIPNMKNLHVFDWVCDKCGYRRYQGGDPKDCPKCDNTTSFTRDIVWQPKDSPNSKSFCFDETLHFQYFRNFSKRPEGKGPLSESMSIQGSFFMVHRDKYWELNLCDEKFGSWGQQGVEVACKTWLSGGKVMCYHDTWYAHMFRTQDGFKFPYPNPESAIQRAREYSRNLFLNGEWPMAKYNLAWLLEKFWPVDHWSDEGFRQVKERFAKKRELRKGIVYYTDSELDPELQDKCVKQLKKAAGDIPIVYVSLKPMKEVPNFVYGGERGYLTMARQIKSGLEMLKDVDVVFFAEHDVLYNPSHFDFLPSDDRTYYYNTNVWRVRFEDGHGIRTDDCRQLSGICAYRNLLLEHFAKRVSLLENFNGTEEEFKRYVRQMGFEPGTHNRDERVDDYKSTNWESAKPNLDIRHNKNLTPSRWNKDQFRNQKYTKGWRETDEFPGWGKFKEFYPAI